MSDCIQLLGIDTWIYARIYGLTCDGTYSSLLYGTVDDCAEPKSPERYLSTYRHCSTVSGALCKLSEIESTWYGHGNAELIGRWNICVKCALLCIMENKGVALLKEIHSMMKLINLFFVFVRSRFLIPCVCLLMQPVLYKIISWFPSLISISILVYSTFIRYTFVFLSRARCIARKDRRYFSSRNVSLKNFNIYLVLVVCLAVKATCHLLCTGSRSADTGKFS